MEAAVAVRFSIKGEGKGGGGQDAVGAKLVLLEGRDTTNYISHNFCSYNQLANEGTCGRSLVNVTPTWKSKTSVATQGVQKLIRNGIRDMMQLGLEFARLSKEFWEDFGSKLWGE
eukprot:1801792-Karenia_brevis.AAC.1